MITGGKKQIRRNAAAISQMMPIVNPRIKTPKKMSNPYARMYIGKITAGLINDKFKGNILTPDMKEILEGEYFDIEVMCQAAEIPNVEIGVYFSAFRHGQFWICTGIYEGVSESSDLLSSEDYSSDHRLSSDDVLISSDVLLSTHDFFSSQDFDSDLPLSSEDFVSSGFLISSDDILSSGVLISSDETISSDMLVSSDERISSDMIFSSGEKLSSDDLISSGEKISSDLTQSSGELISSDDTLSSDELISSDEPLSSQVKGSSDFPSSEAPSSGIGSSDSPSSDAPSSDVQSSDAPSSDALSSEEYDGDICSGRAGCSEDTPRFVEVTFSGVDIADGCLDCPIISDQKWDGVPDINGTYILEQDEADACKWKYTESISSTYWSGCSSSDGTCQNCGTTETHNELEIILSYSGSSLSLSARIKGTLSRLMFSDSGVSPTDCAESNAFASTISGVAGCNDNAGSGGTASSKGIYSGL